MSTLLVDVLEQRDVTVLDVSIACLQTNIPVDKRILLHTIDEFVDIIFEVNHDYKPYIQY